MAMASFMGVFGLLLYLCIILVPIALLIVLQVWLCRKGGKLGLILPVLSLLISLVMVLGLAGFSREITGESYLMTDEYGQVIEHHEEHVEHTVPLTPGTVAAVAVLFLAANIPTVVFGGIWLHYKNRRDFKDDLKRMKIEDLE